MWATLAAAFGAFAATNLDDLLVLCLLFAQAGDGISRSRILLGQLLGLGALTGLSILGGLGLGLLPQSWLRLLGLVPILLALRLLCRREEEGQTGSLPLSVTGVAALALAGGGDNLGVYVPLFAQLDGRQTALTALVFGLCVVLWCALARKLTAWPRLQALIGRHKGWLVPFVFLLLGVGILIG